mmetsp:Transcript_8133/g.19082  ORF Transcript_8133/g.19082 Transcript_8133/m.19082 type:complete len:239 (-) Transcript_8133:450-1166(-)
MSQPERELHGASWKRRPKKTRRRNKKLMTTQAQSGQSLTIGTWISRAPNQVRRMGRKRRRMRLKVQKLARNLRLWTMTAMARTGTWTSTRRWGLGSSDPHQSHRLQCLRDRHRQLAHRHRHRQAQVLHRRSQHGHLHRRSWRRLQVQTHHQHHHPHQPPINRRPRPHCPRPHHPHQPLPVIQRPASIRLQRRRLPHSCLLPAPQGSRQTKLIRCYHRAEGLRPMVQACMARRRALDRP